MKVCALISQTDCRSDLAGGAFGSEQGQRPLSDFHRIGALRDGLADCLQHRPCQAGTFLITERYVTQ